jgi:hypothetical protein
VLNLRITTMGLVLDIPVAAPVERRLKFIIAVKNGDLQEVRRLIEVGADRNSADKNVCAVYSVAMVVHILMLNLVRVQRR